MILRCEVSFPHKCLEQCSAEASRSKLAQIKKSLQRKPLLFYQYLPNSSQSMDGKDSPLAWPLKFQQTKLRFESFTPLPLHSTEAGGMLWFSHLVVSAGLCGSWSSIPCQTELGGAGCPTWVPSTVNWFFISCLAKTGCIPIPPPE